VDYATKRTPLRVLILISVIWITSILISSCHLLPIFRDKRRRPVDQCHVTGNVLYTIFSTVGAFHIPLIGMCIIYWKIFQAAKFRIRRKGFNTSAPTSPALIHQPHEILPPSPILTPNHHTDSRKSPLNRIKFLKQNHYINHHANDIEPDNPSTYSTSTNHHNDYQLKPLKKISTPLLKKKLKKKHADELNQPANSSVLSTRRLITSSMNNDLAIPINTINNPLATSNSSPSNSPRLHNTHIVVTDSNNTIITKSSAAISRKRIDLKRERKATKVLGVVMGCFILCWFPFFIEETISGIFRLTINEKIMSVLTWLGYFNSLLNPVIYTIFAPDFRQAFGKILFGTYRKRR
jgi:5-hydroxytryptamine receptor 1